MVSSVDDQFWKNYLQSFLPMWAIGKTWQSFWKFLVTYFLQFDKLLHIWPGNRSRRQATDIPDTIAGINSLVALLKVRGLRTSRGDGIGGVREGTRAPITQRELRRKGSNGSGHSLRIHESCCSIPNLFLIRYLTYMQAVHQMQ
ncbi:hypothetical protein VTN31DRAFT_5247 [Thermomyces dupontii]|uniref:uncharacterized protein n=1 Tax=Talaromyces thermophilus TaxID=28565 RepID=UPI003742DC4B